MIIKSTLLLLIAFFIIDARAFNNTVDYFEDSFARNRSGKFLFDTLFGLEALQDEIVSSSSTNTLKSCDCGKLRDLMGKMKMKVIPLKYSLVECLCHVILKRRERRENFT